MHISGMILLEKVLKNINFTKNKYFIFYKTYLVSKIIGFSRKRTLKNWIKLKETKQAPQIYTFNCLKKISYLLIRLVVCDDIKEEESSIQWKEKKKAKGEWSSESRDSQQNKSQTNLSQDSQENTIFDLQKRKEN